MKRALEIVGDKWHAPAVIHRAIGARLEERGWAVEQCFDRNVPFDRLGQYDLIILSRYALDDEQDNSKEKHLWITGAQELQLEAFVENGGRILFHHDGISHYPRGGGVSRLVRAFRVSHPPIGPITIRTLPNSAGIGRAVDPFTLEDEEFVLEMDEKDVTPFLFSESAERGRHLQGWYHTYGQGKVVVLIPGHEDCIFRHPSIRKIVEDTLTWLET